MSEWTVIRWLLKFVKPLRGKMILAILLGIISNLSVILISLIGAYGILAVILAQPLNPYKWLFVMVGCGVLRGVARYLEQYLNHDIAFRLLAIIRERIFSTLRKLGPARLSGKKSGDLITAITSDVEALEVFFAHTISPVFIALGTTIATVGFLGMYDTGLALILLLGQILVGVVLPMISYKRNKKIGTAYQTEFVGLNQAVMENIASLQDIFQFKLGEARLANLTDRGEKLNKQYQKRLRQGSELQILGEWVLIGTATLILVLGSFWQLPLETILIGTVLSLSSFGSVLALNALGTALLTTFASGKRLYALTEEKPVVTFNGQLELTDFESAELNKVCFSHDGKQAILNELSLDLPKGKWLGIGGESGSGKSTLVKLLMRYWDPDGEVNFNNQPLPKITESSLHQIEGVMEQSTFLFEDTIGNNIRLGKKAATLDEVKVAARKAAIDKWIETLPEGYDTKIGGQARNLSDGERQRIGLARLFLHDAPLLLLDEPTSNLDYINEQAILNTLRSEIQDKTVLVISHRKTTLDLAEEQWLLENGVLKQAIE
ncbi:ABC transporter ATP-binding protein [Listeria monocytogenes]|uniref:Putative glutathione/cysteine uptake ABC transporter, fused permease/ATP-binding protein n=1 Tax=Listeria monocytogenes serotype 4a (strain M7) TaxID=1030009 RepID=A0A0E0UVY3_LISMM|nr:ABC transporter ATP-binding protein [Listeria monocytogenes]ACK39866.1 ABC transporter, ATP-binding/permease protein [Listeria monocytogenes HCC23]AEH92140.1 putative glutathione/cysteine uptake ABC transporter, fused permease/ATP-binding protein [Listeria monocytogenes M7]AKS53709.1 ABC transporter ATP-binding protein [Listeria monocytogenes]EAC6862012.1 ABC transporter ATP-binding protein [Listeria monocytogenes]EAD0180793.1 ABC transporter ATP-binding protein [Listeria monocytogenes]